MSDWKEEGAWCDKASLLIERSCGRIVVEKQV